MEYQLCENCRWSEFDFARDIELQCQKGRDLEFIPPPNGWIDAKADPKWRQWVDRQWGWRHVVREGKRVFPVHCPDYGPRP